MKTSSKVLNISLWVVQGILAASLFWGASMKLLQTPQELSVMWPWAEEVPIALLKGTAIIDLLGGIGLILPALLRIKPQLTAWSAVGVIVLMICASVFHISRGEASQIGANVVFAIMAAFVAWGRFGKARN